MKDKRGIEIVVTTVLMIVLSIAALTILMLVVNSQTQFFSRWTKSQNQESNVDAFISNCNLLITTESYYSYCCEKKEVRFFEDDKIKSIKVSCDGAREYNWSAGRLDSYGCEISC